MEDPQPSAPRRVEAYLDSVLASLPRRLSAFQLDELRRELRTHLWERVAAYEELGQTEDDAVTEALAQFGGGKDFLKQWRQEWRRPAKRISAREAWEAMRLALPLSLSSLVLAQTGLMLLSYFAKPDALGRLFFNIFAAGVGLGGIVLAPLVLGVVHSRRTPHRAVLGIFGALSLELTGLGTLTLLAGQFLPGWDQNHTVQDFEALLFDIFLWLPLACGAAALTGWWTRRAEGRRVA